MTDTPENARIAQGSTLVIIDFILKPASENEGIAAAIGMGCGVVVFVIYLLCLKCCFQDVGSERSRKWFKTPPQGGDGAMGGHYNGSGGTLAGSASHLNGLGTLTGGDPEAEYQLRMLLNAMSTTGSPRSQLGGGGGGSPRGEGNSNLQNSFSAAAVQSGSFTGYPPASTTTTGALMTAAATAASAVPPPRGASAESLSSLRRGQQQEQQVVVVPDAVNSTAPPPLDGSPPMVPPR